MKIVFGLGLSLLLSPSIAHAADASVTITGEYVTEYVFRGVTLAGEAIQPSAEASFRNITVGVWSSFAMGEEKAAFADEVDFYINTGWELTDFVSGEFGATLYHYPQSGGLFDVGSDVEDASTVEIYGGLDFDVPLSPSLSGYYDVHLKTVTLESSLTYSLAIIDRLMLEASVNAGLVEGSEGVNYQYGKISGKTYLDVTDNAAFFAGAYYGLSSKNTFLDTDFDLSDTTTLKDPTKNSAWFSVGVTSTF